MDKRDVIIFMDLGSSEIRAVAGYVNENDELLILGDVQKPTAGIKNGIVIDPHNTAYDISELIKLLLNSARLQEISALVISVNARTMHNYLHTVESPISNFVSDSLLKDLEERCRKEVESDQIHIFDCKPKTYYIDGEEVDSPARMQGSRITAEFNLIIGSQLIMESIEKAFIRTTYPVKMVLLDHEALSTVLLEEEEREDGVALISMGAGTTSLSIYKNGKLQNFAVVPLGGFNITRDIASLDISLRNAEKLKTRIGVAAEEYLENLINVALPTIDNPAGKKLKISSRFLAQIIEARLSETMNPVFDQLNKFPDPLNSGIVITGGASELKHLDKYIRDMTGFEVRQGSHADWLSDENKDKYFKPEWSLAAGVLILGHDRLQKQKSEANVIDPPIQKKNIFARAVNNFQAKMGDLFEYDNIEIKNNEGAN